MAAERHSPAAAALLSVEIEGNAILKWAGWRRRRRKTGRGRGKDIEDVKKTMASTLQHSAFAWKREQIIKKKKETDNATLSTQETFTQ